MLNFQDFLILAIIEVVLLFVFKNYIGSYSKKKGENQATKEDIHELTRKVEAVRSDFAFISSRNLNRYEKEIENHEKLIQTFQLLQYNWKTYYPHSLLEMENRHEFLNQFEKIENNCNRIVSLTGILRLYCLNNNVLSKLDDFHVKNMTLVRKAVLVQYQLLGFELPLIGYETSTDVKNVEQIQSLILKLTDIQKDASNFLKEFQVEYSKLIRDEVFKDDKADR